MNIKSYISDVNSDHECDGLPEKATFDITPQLAAEIIKLAGVVKANDLYSVERFYYAPTWYAEYFEELAEIDADAELVRTECGCLSVSIDEFWFTASIKHTNVSITTERFKISDLSELLPPGGDEDAISSGPTKPETFSWREQGDANDYVIFKDDNWFALVQMNGEMSAGQQAAWLDRVIGLFDAPDKTQTPQDPRVLVTVSGGVADYVCDCGVDVEVFDHDNYNDDKVGTSKAPRSFADLARPVDVPFESRFEEMASAAGISMNFDDDIGKYRWESEKEGMAQPGWDTELEAWQDACVANDLIKKVKDQYAESIIGDDSSWFDAIEIHGVIHVESELNGGDPVCEINDEEPEFYSVYLHLKEGGVDCVGDFSLLPEAIAYASALSIQYGWECSSCLSF